MTPTMPTMPTTPTAPATTLDEALAGMHGQILHWLDGEKDSLAAGKEILRRHIAQMRATQARIRQLQGIAASFSAIGAVANPPPPSKPRT